MNLTNKQQNQIVAKTVEAISTRISPTIPKLNAGKNTNMERVKNFIVLLNKATGLTWKYHMGFFKTNKVVTNKQVESILKSLPDYKKLAGKWNTARKEFGFDQTWEIKNPKTKDAILIYISGNETHLEFDPNPQ